MLKRLKKIQTFLKEYFIFSTGERKGIIALLALLLLLIALPYFYDVLFPQPPYTVEITDLETLDDAHASFASNVHAGTKNYFPFDPNTANNEELAQLGFSERQIKTIRNYLLKGGKFRKPADLAKIYGIKPELYEKLEPFITIRSQWFISHPFDSARSSKKSAPQKIVELNTADSVELVALYRIGPSLAHRIIEYRDKLGGFVSIDQLKELWGFDEDILYDLQGKIKVDARRAKIHDVNTVSADELKTHPYFKYKLSNAIVNYRMQHGNYAKMEDLKKIVLVNDSIYKRITLYLRLN